jgi:hypothetical protein
MLPSVADRINLMPLYDRISDKLRKTDPNHILFIESVTWDDIVPVGFNHPPGGHEFASKSGLSSHYYYPPNIYQHWHFERRVADMKSLKMGGILSEF